MMLEYHLIKTSANELCYDTYARIFFVVSRREVEH